MVAGHYIDGDYNVVRGVDEIHGATTGWLRPIPRQITNLRERNISREQGLGSSMDAIFRGGKTTLIRFSGSTEILDAARPSYVIENVKQSCKNKDSVGYAYFFFDGMSAQSKLAAHESLIRSLIMQFSDRLDGIHPALADLYDAEDKGRHQPLISSLEDTLLEIIKSFSSAYIIIDALDECAEQRRVLNWIQSITLQTSSSLHLLITSRPEPDIENSLRSLRNTRGINLTDQQASEDIYNYINARLSEVDGWTEYQKELVRAALSRGANGVFRWVALQFDELLAERCLSTWELKQRLASLPKGLDAAYMKIIKQSPRPADVIRFLQWIVFGQQEFTARELAEVALINFGNGGDTLPFCDSSRRYSSPDDVLRACSGLLVKSEYRGTIRLAHFSVKEFLLSTTIPLVTTHSIRADECLSHSVIAQSCIAYLLQFDKSESITIADIRSFPLAIYASKQCVFHVESARGRDMNPTLERLIEHLVALDPSYALANWIRLRSSSERQDKTISFESDLELENFGLPLYYASTIGLTPLVDYLINRGASIDALGGKWGTALEAASAEGHLKTCQLLLGHGADINAAGGKYGTALQTASYKDELEICELLLEQGANVNIMGGYYGTALQAASSKGRLEICQLLLKHGADLDAAGGEYGAALQAASYEGQLEICQLLLEQGADTNVGGGRYGPALQVASMWGRLDICQLMFEHGADLDAVGGEYGTALQAAAAGGHLSTCQLLLEQGAQVNVSGRKYGTALQTASYEGQLEICQLLIEHGADVNASGEKYGAALWAASHGGHLEISQLLLKHGADVNAAEGEYGTALQAASYAGQLEICQLLVEQGADVNAAGGYYGVALQAASLRGHFDICRLLLDQGADVNATGGRHGTSPNAVRLLRPEDCAWKGQAGGEYGTALQASSYLGRHETCRLLLEHGANVNTTGGKYGTALLAALHSRSGRGHDEICQLLLEHGADVNATGEEYGTALQAALCWGRLKICQLLLEQGADVNAKGGKYGTVLNAARVRPPEYSYRKSAATIQKMVQLLKRHGAVESVAPAQPDEDCRRYN
ncbi:hypothetical protein HWV62_30939 [Athelia sp. TMB]|nr:hypothetical protein HWV62_30939 [Athelia sp. TMB]